MKLSLRRRTLGWLAVAATSLALLGAGCEDNDDTNGLNGTNGDTAPAPAEPDDGGLDDLNGNDDGGI